MRWSSLVLSIGILGLAVTALLAAPSQTSLYLV